MSDVKEGPIAGVYFDSSGVALRLRLSIRTIERWRWVGCGPKYIKLGGKIVYKLSDVEDFEKQHKNTES